MSPSALPNGVKAHVSGLTNGHVEGLTNGTSGVLTDMGGLTNGHTDTILNGTDDIIPNGINGNADHRIDPALPTKIAV